MVFIRPKRTKVLKILFISTHIYYIAKSASGQDKATRGPTTVF